eukprot:8528367-Karenia_brevis.AAC.1
MQTQLEEERVTSRHRQRLEKGAELLDKFHNSLGLLGASETWRNLQFNAQGHNLQYRHQRSGCCYLADFKSQEQKQYGPSSALRHQRPRDSTL